MQILRCDLHFKVFNSPYLLGSEALLIIDLCASGNHISIFCVVFNDSNNSNMQKVVLWTISLIISSKHHSFFAAFFFQEPRLSLNKKKKKRLKNHKLDCAMRHWRAKLQSATLCTGRRLSMFSLSLKQQTDSGCSAVQGPVWPCPQSPLLMLTFFHHKSGLRLWNSSLILNQKTKKHTRIKKKKQGDLPLVLPLTQKVSLSPLLIRIVRVAARSYESLHPPHD